MSSRPDRMGFLDAELDPLDAQGLRLHLAPETAAALCAIGDVGGRELDIL